MSGLAIGGLYDIRVRPYAVSQDGKNRAGGTWSDTEVMFTTNANGSGAADNITTLGKKKTSYTRKGLKSGTTYYVQVRELKKVGTTTYVGNISVPLAVKVK